MTIVRPGSVVVESGCTNVVEILRRGIEVGRGGYQTKDTRPVSLGKRRIQSTIERRQF